jgi:hypothetical protein
VSWASKDFDPSRSFGMPSWHQRPDHYFTC